MIYRKPEPSTERGLCVVCNKNLQKRKPNNKFSALCSPCDKRRWGEKPTKPRKRRSRIQHRKKRYGGYVKLKHCESCGFVAKHSCQLDVDHIDGNHNNNEKSNLQTLCANCHRLKTLINKDYESS